MNVNQRRMSGASLVEVLLGLSIASSIIMLGMRQYKSMRIDADIQQVSSNVDLVFQAAADYYQANCRRQWSPVSGPIVGTGTLDPANAPANPFPVTVAALTSGNFLQAALPINKIVNNSGTNNGYMAQFNLTTPVPFRSITSLPTTKLGQIIMWRIQVAVELRNVATATQYMSMLRGDCLSILNAAGTGVRPCSEGTGASSSPVYVVWERLPSFAVPESNSNMWTTKAKNKVFNQQYETYPILYLGGLLPSAYPQQNYLCGS